MDKNFSAFTNDARSFMENRVVDDYLRCVAYGSDASCYDYIPKVVVFPNSEDEVVKLINLANKHKTPLCFRAAGSSLSGQASCEDVLVVANDNWKKVEVSDDKNSIKLGCGVYGSDANDALKGLQRKIGPDPATIKTALIGGIINNNASGMCCGVKQNSYQTIKSLRVILHNGLIVDTSSDESVKNFIEKCPDMVKDLLNLKDEISSDEELTALINKKYKIKNTTGYGLNTFIDFHDIKDILNHIFVGSEGTLGFVSEVVLEIVDDPKYKACGLLFFENFSKASEVVVALTDLGDIVVSAEMMDYACLKSVQGMDGMPEIVNDVKEGNACILFQTESCDEDKLNSQLEKIKNTINKFEMVFEPLYSKESEIYNKWWNIRKGILPITAGKRRVGASVIVEDVCFEVDKFCQGAEYIAELFKKYDFEDSGIIFGHALAGNLHFVITPLLSDETEKANFQGLLDDMAQKVTSMGGSLKAEHGTGRMVAPYVELEWGKKAYEINKKVKKIFDPNTIFNPDVIISENKNIHIRNLKNVNKSFDFIDKCMECGFCERACPSKFLTLTPRQRIVIERHICALKKDKKFDLAKKLKKEYEYLVNETCAACGMCGLLCPLSITAGDIALHTRKENSQKSFKTANKVYNNIDKTIKIAKFGLKNAHLFYSIFTPNFVSKASLKINKFMPFPYINEYLPKANNYKFQNKTGFEKSILYFTTCINRGFTPPKKGVKSIQETVESICKKAKINVIYPSNLDKLCCGKSFMDYPEIREKNKAKLKELLLKETDGGEIPIMLDHSACSVFLMGELKEIKELKIYDISEFLLEVVEYSNVKKIDENILIHNMCTMKKIGKGEVIEKLASKLTLKKVFDTKVECCGFAGDKGFFTPELNLSATKNMKFIDPSIKRAYSTSSTCEIGLSHASKRQFLNIAYLVDECLI